MERLVSWDPNNNNYIHPTIVLIYNYYCYCHGKSESVSFQVVLMAVRWSRRHCGGALRWCRRVIPILFTLPIGHFIIAPNRPNQLAAVKMDVVCDTKSIRSTIGLPWQYTSRAVQVVLIRQL